MRRQKIDTPIVSIGLAPVDECALRRSVPTTMCPAESSDGLMERRDGGNLGDPVTFDELMRRVRQRLLMKALGLTRDNDEAEDLVQKASERAVKSKSPHPRDVDEFEAWMTVIQRRLFFDEWRARKRRPRPEPLGDRHDVPAPTAEESSPWSKVTTAQLEDAIATLPEKYREPYKRHAAGKSYRQIGNELGLPGNTVGTHLRKARQLLRDCLLDSSDREGGGE